MYKYFNKLRTQLRGRVFRDVIKHLSDAFRLSRQTICDVVSKKRAAPTNRRRKRNELDEFDREVLARIMQDLYRKKHLPTLKMIKVKLAQKSIDINVQRLSYELKKLGFAWKKVGENRKKFVCRGDVTDARATYLRTVKAFRNNGYQIVYLDETFVNKNHCSSHAWLPDVDCNDILTLVKNRDIELPDVPSGKGKRLIVLHAGSDQCGFIQNCREVFVGKSIDGDYHQEMDSTVFLNWFEHDLIIGLDCPSLIVLDNASYHNIRVEDTVTPTLSARKQVLQDWLTARDIPYQPVMTKTQLYDIIKRNKITARYKTDDLAESHGHFVLRTPVRHCELNPIELIWAQVKGHVARNNCTFKLRDVKALVNEAFDMVTKRNWEKCVQHTIKIENELWRHEGIQRAINPVIINLESSDDTDEYGLDDTVEYSFDNAE